jgi:hypothetical protein
VAKAAAHKGRTYDCTRPSCTNAHKNPCQTGASTYDNAYSTANPRTLCRPRMSWFRSRVSKPGDPVLPSVAYSMAFSFHVSLLCRDDPGGPGSRTISRRSRCSWRRTSRVGSPAIRWRFRGAWARRSRPCAGGPRGTNRPAPDLWQHYGSRSQLGCRGRSARCPIRKQ